MAKLLGMTISVFLFLLGLLFLVAAFTSNPVPRAAVGVIAVGMAAGVAYLTSTRTREVVRKVDVTQQVELSGEVDLASLKCKNCGAVLDRKSVEVRAGAVFVKCEFCGNDYQIQEEPKW